MINQQEKKKRIPFFLFESDQDWSFVFSSFFSSLPLISIVESEEKKDFR